MLDALFATIVNRLERVIRVSPDTSRGMAYVKPQRFTSLHKIAIKLLESSKSDYVADLGCGDGLILSVIEGALKTGVDYSIVRIKRAQEKGLMVILADVQWLPFKEDVFTKVIANEILEHVPMPDQFVKEVIYCSRGGGEVVIAVPNEIPFLIYRLLTLKWSQITECEKQHHTSWTMETLMKFLTKFELKVYRKIYHKVFGIPFHFLVKAYVNK